MLQHVWIWKYSIKPWWNVSSFIVYPLIIISKFLLLLLLKLSSSFFFRHQFLHVALSNSLFIPIVSCSSSSLVFCIVVVHFASFLLSFPKCLFTSSAQHMIYPNYGLPSLYFLFFSLHHISTASSVCTSSSVRHHVSDACNSTLHMNTLIILFYISLLKEFVRLKTMWVPYIESQFKVRSQSLT